MRETVAEAWSEFWATEAPTADRQAFSEEFNSPGFIDARKRESQVRDRHGIGNQ